jgi:hypothetical protein
LRNDVLRNQFVVIGLDQGQMVMSAPGRGKVSKNTHIVPMRV